MPVFLLPLLNWLAGFITGPLMKNAVDAWKAKLDSNGTIDQHTVDLAARELLVEQREREVDAQVTVAEQGHWYTAIVRPLFAAPFVIFLWKVIVIDKVLGAWTQTTTDNLSPDMWKWGGTILVAYFGGRSLEKVAAIITTRRAK